MCNECLEQLQTKWAPGLFWSYSMYSMKQFHSRRTITSTSRWREKKTIFTLCRSGREKTIRLVVGEKEKNVFLKLNSNNERSNLKRLCLGFFNQFTKGAFKCRAIAQFYAGFIKSCAKISKGSVKNVEVRLFLLSRLSAENFNN